MSGCPFVRYIKLWYPLSDTDETWYVQWSNLNNTFAQAGSCPCPTWAVSGGQKRNASSPSNFGTLCSIFINFVCMSFLTIFNGPDHRIVKLERYLEIFLSKVSSLYKRAKRATFRYGEAASNRERSDRPCEFIIQKLIWFLVYKANLCLPTKYQFYSVLRYVYSRSNWEKKTLFVTIVLDSVYNFDQVEALEFILYCCSCIS